MPKLLQLDTAFQFHIRFRTSKNAAENTLQERLFEKKRHTHTHTASDVFDQFKLSWAQPPWLIEETPQVSKPIGVPNEPPFWTPNKTSLDALFVSNPSQQCSVVPNVFGRWLTCGEARGALPACRRVSKSRSSDLLILFGGLLLEFIGSSFVHMNLFYSSSP